MIVRILGAVFLVEAAYALATAIDVAAYEGMGSPGAVRLMFIAAIALTLGLHYLPSDPRHSALARPKIPAGPLLVELMRPAGTPDVSPRSRK